MGGPGGAAALPLRETRAMPWAESWHFDHNYKRKTIMIFIILIDINSTYLSWQIIIKPIEEGKLSEKQKAQVLPIYSSIFCKAVPTELLAETVLIASCELRRVTRGEGSLPPDRLLTSAEKKKKQLLSLIHHLKLCYIACLTLLRESRRLGARWYCLAAGSRVWGEH